MRLIALLLPLLLAVGCATSTSPGSGPHFATTNYHSGPFPPSLRRVALLPVATHASNSTLAAGSEELLPVLEAELRKTGAFEVVLVSERNLRDWTGNARWRPDEQLPRDFLNRVRTETGCDAILFPTLTLYRPYPPLAIGLDLRLISGEDLVPIWAIDEVMDAGAAPVARGARGYSQTQIIVREGEEGAVLQSPRFFSRYVCSTLLATLPTIDKSLQESAKPTKTMVAGKP